MSMVRDVRKLFEPAPPSSRWGSWTPAAVTAVGALSAILLLWTHRLADDHTRQNLVVFEAVSDLQIAVAYWHLWLEEHLSQDPYVDLERDVRVYREEALRLASRLVQGGTNAAGATIGPLQEPPLREIAEKLEGALTEFRKISDERLAQPQRAGVGTTIDQAFDAEFLRVRRYAAELRRLFLERIARDRAEFRLRVWLTAAVWSAIVAAAVVGLWGRERRRREAEDTLRRSQRWLATTLSSIGDAVVTTDLEGRIFFLNPMAEKLTGWPRNEAMGRPIEEVFEVYRESDSQPADNPVTEVLRTGKRRGVINHTVIVDRHHEHCYAIDEGAAPIRDQHGELLGVVLVFRDVSARRQAERALHQREAELRQAQKMEAVGRLAGGIAHDVNNYLGAIRGYCEVAMLKGESGEPLTQRMTAAVETADKVSALIRQLLAFSRRQPVQAERVDLNRVVDDMELLMERLLGEDIAFTTDLESELWSIESDPSQIEQVLVNLLVNARDAMPTGGSITIATRNVAIGHGDRRKRLAARPGRWVRLTVRDTGCGIPAEIHDQVFDPFFTTKAESGSSGLGLATVYAIVEQNGGVVGFESERGRGTCFEILLPASDQPPTVQAPAVAPAVRAGRPAEVLLVEDNDDMRASTRAMLETLGHRVTTAPDGAAALELLGDGGADFDLLITDVIMPGISGRELYDRLLERYGSVRCLFISGYTDNVMLRHGVAQDRVHFLHKPFSVDDLAGKIAEALESPAGEHG